MKLLLSSAGFENPNIGKKFLELINKPASDIKVIFIPTAAVTKEEKYWVGECLKELAKIGIAEDNIKTLELDHKLSYEEVKDYDVLYIVGGNTFYLLKKARYSGFKEIITHFLKDEKLYFGVSAGSALVCPDIKYIEKYDNNEYVKDTTGLNFTNKIIFVHYTKQDKELVDEEIAKSKHRAVILTDNQALLVTNGKEEIVE